MSALDAFLWALTAIGVVFALMMLLACAAFILRLWRDGRDE